MLNTRRREIVCYLLAMMSGMQCVNSIGSIKEEELEKKKREDSRNTASNS